MSDLSRAGPPGTRQGWLGPVAVPVLGEGWGSEPPPSVPAPGSRPICTVEAISRTGSPREAAHLASGTACVLGCALRHTCELDAQRCLSGRLALAWSRSTRPAPWAPLGPAGGTGCLSRLSAACPAWPGPKFPFQLRRPPPPPAAVEAKPRIAAGTRPGWVAGQQGPRCSWGSPAQGSPSWSVSIGGWLSARISTLSYCPHLRPSPSPPAAVGCPLPQGMFMGSVSPRREIGGCSAQTPVPPVVPAAGTTGRCRHSPSLKGLQSSPLSSGGGPRNDTCLPFASQAWPSGVISPAPPLSPFSLDRSLGLTPIVEGEVQGCGQIRQ